VEWLLSLYANGLSGVRDPFSFPKFLTCLRQILADEMGLGKTIQTIAFLAHLRENGVFGAVLVVCPLSTLANWVNEFERFTPDIPVILYHGTPDERAAMREEQLGLPATTKGKGKKPARSVGRKNVKADGEGFPIIITSYELVMNDRVYLSKIDVRACSRLFVASNDQLLVQIHHCGRVASPEEP
jgi:ATP-dependent DNA helicase